MKNNTKNRIFILSTAIVLILAFIIYFKLSLDKEVKFIIETKKSNFIISEKLQSASKIKNKIKDLEEVKTSLDAFFVDKKNILSFIESLEKEATANGVDLVINSVNVDETHLKESFPYSPLNITLTATGKFSSVNSFLVSLEKLPYYVDFNTVKLVSTGNNDSSNWTVNVSLSSMTK